MKPRSMRMRLKQTEGREISKYTHHGKGRRTFVCFLLLPLLSLSSPPFYWMNECLCPASISSSVRLFRVSLFSLLFFLSYFVIIISDCQPKWQFILRLTHHFIMPLFLLYFSLLFSSPLFLPLNTCSLFPWLLLSGLFLLLYPQL